MTEARDLVEALGGYRAVAADLGVKPTTLHTYLSSQLPAKWYVAFNDLCSRRRLPPPRMSAFAFVELPAAKIERDGRAA